MTKYPWSFFMSDNKVFPFHLLWRRQLTKHGTKERKVARQVGVQWGQVQPSCTTPQYLVVNGCVFLSSSSNTKLKVAAHFFRQLHLPCQWPPWSEMFWQEQTPTTSTQTKNNCWADRLTFVYPFTRGKGAKWKCWQKSQVPCCIPKLQINHQITHDQLQQW